MKNEKRSTGGSVLLFNTSNKVGSRFLVASIVAWTSDTIKKEC
jgi:hypothetical protein